MSEFKLPSLKEARQRSRKAIEADLFVLNDTYKNLGKDKTFYIQTHGCQANFHDSEVMAGILQDMGFKMNSDISNADIIIVNTCAIRQNAEEKVLGELGYYKEYKRKNPNLIIGLAGCMAQEEESVALILKKYKQVDLIFGTHNIYRLPELLYKCIAEKKRIVEIFSKQGEIVENLPKERDSKHKAWVNIMYGCDKFCTYCIVPYTRGKERSRRLEDIVSEVQGLRGAGYREVTLLGQNVNAYGLDIEMQHGFADLLAACAQTGIERIRFMTPHPRNFDQECIDILAKYDNLMPFVHLPLQSGSNRVLKAMNRSYTKEEYLDLFDRIKAKIPNVAVTTDIIVGFPNETEAEFLETLELYEYCKYANAFTFIYSPRIGTPAASLEDDIADSIKEERLQRLNARVKFYAKEANKALEGQVVEVMCDGHSKKRADIYAGYTPDNKLVNFKAEHCEVGDLVQVKILEAKNFSLNGIALNINKPFKI